MKIRKASSEQDLRLVAELAEKIWHQHFTPIIGKAQVEYMVEKFQSYPALQEAVQKHGYIYFMAEDAQGLRGYCGVRPEENDSLFLSKLYVEQSARGQGVSTMLLNAAIKEFSPKRVWLTVNRHNDTTIAIYRHIGFSVIREQKADIGGGFVMDDYVMELTL